MASVRCAACQSEVTPALFAQGAAARCPFCGKLNHFFPQAALRRAAFAAPPSLPDDAALVEGDPICFYSPARRATKVCGHCGVFISDAWAAAWGSQTVCLKCLEQLRLKSQDQRFEASRPLWDNVALGLVVVPVVLAIALLFTIVGYVFSILLLMTTFVTAPAAIFVGLRYWNAPRSLVPRGRFRLIVALALALALVAAWAVLILHAVDLIK